MKVIIIGGGQVGAYIGGLLLENENDIIIVDNRPRVIEKLLREFDEKYIVTGDGADPSVLEEAGIAEADAVVSVTGADEVNLVASTIAKYEFGVERCIARVNNPKNAWLFDRTNGVDVRVNQADLLAKIVVDEIDLKNLFTLMKINRGEYSIIHLKVAPQSLSVNKQVKDLVIPEQAVFIAITRNHEVVIPRGDTEILAEDVILALADQESTKELHHLFGE